MDGRIKVNTSFRGSTPTVGWNFLQRIKVMTASKNPVKIKAVNEAFRPFFQELLVESAEIIVPTINNTQPIGEEETSKHSRLRIIQAKKSYPGYDYYVGIVNLSSGKARIVVYSSVGNEENIETIRGCEILLPIEWYSSLN